MGPKFAISVIRNLKCLSWNLLFFGFRQKELKSIMQIKNIIIFFNIWQRGLKLILRSPFDAADPCQRICQRLTKLHLKIFLTDIFGMNRPNKVLFIFQSSLSSISSSSNLRCSKYRTCHLCRTVNMFSKRGAIRNQRDVKLNFIFSPMCLLCSTWQKGGWHAL